MSEGLVGFGHAVRVFALLDGAAAQVRRVEQLVGELLLHRLAVAALTRVADQPADAERQAAVRVHFDRHLIVTAADAARLDLEARLDVVERLLEHLERIVAGPLLDDVEALVEDALRRAPLAVAHHGVDELADQRAVVNRVSGKFALRDFSSAWHVSSCPSFAVVPTTSGAWRRTSIVPACGRRRPLRRACRGPRGSERPGGP